MSTTQFPNPHKSVDTDTTAGLEQSCAALRAACRRALKHLDRKLEKQRVELDEGSRFAWYREIGDSLLATPGVAPRGTTECVLQNIHTQKTERITLNPKLDAKENAALLYKKARKGERSLGIIQGNVKKTRADIGKIEQALEKLKKIPEKNHTPEETSASLAEAERILRETVTDVHAPRGNTYINKDEVPFRHLNVDGWDIFIGKNDAQNDELSVRFVKPWDLWLHVATYAGSHVVIRREKGSEQPPQEIIGKAAALAGWFSKARHSSFVEVHVTEGRYVHKRRKAPAGEVTIDRHKTIRIAPKSPQELFRKTMRDE